MMGAAAGAIMNALKTLAGISMDLDLISPIVMEPIQELKTKNFGSINPRLHADEVLLALAICAATNPIAELAMKQIPRLKNCEAHSSVILSHVDLDLFKKLGVNLSCEPRYQAKKLFHK